MRVRPLDFHDKAQHPEIVASFTGASGRQRTFNDDVTTLTNAVNIMVNAYGTLKVRF